MFRYFVAVTLSLGLLAAPAAHGRVFSKPGWYLMIGEGTPNDPKIPMRGPYSTRALCLQELEEWVEMTDGTEALDCNYLHEGPEHDPLSPG